MKRRGMRCSEPHKGEEGRGRGREGEIQEPGKVKVSGGGREGANISLGHT